MPPFSVTKTAKARPCFSYAGPLLTLNTPTHSYPRTFALIVPLPEIPFLLSSLWLTPSLTSGLHANDPVHSASNSNLPQHFNSCPASLLSRMHLTQCRMYLSAICFPHYLSSMKPTLCLVPCCVPNKNSARRVAGAQQIFAEQMHGGMYK